MNDTTWDRSGQVFAYVASGEQHSSQNGISVHRLDPADGRMELLQEVALPSPSFLAVSASRSTLYAASRASRGEPGPDDAIVAYSIDPVTGRLTYVNRTAIVPYPTYLSLDHAEQYALLVSAFSGAICVAPLLPGGRLGDVEVRRLPGTSLIEQGLAHSSIGKARWAYGSTPFPHSILTSPDNRFALIGDVGTNRVHVFRLSAEGVLTESDPPATEGVPITKEWIRDQNPVWDNPTGAGPRHMEFHPDGRRLYVVNEAGSVVTVFDYDAAGGRLTLAQEISTLPSDFVGSSSPADIHVHPSGRFVYATNRRHNSVVGYAVDPETGRLGVIGFTPTQGDQPRHFAFSPDGTLLLLSNMGSDAIVVFSVDSETGVLTPNGTVTKVLSPVCTVLHQP